jgi:hypothetical protein
MLITWSRKRSAYDGIVFPQVLFHTRPQGKLVIDLSRSWFGCGEVRKNGCVGDELILDGSPPFSDFHGDVRKLGEQLQIGN